MSNDSSDDYWKGFEDGVTRAEATTLLIWVLLIAICVGWLIILVTAPLPAGW